MFAKSIVAALLLPLGSANLARRNLICIREVLLIMRFLVLKTGKATVTSLAFTGRAHLVRRIQDNGFISIGAMIAMPNTTLSGAFAVLAAEEPLVFFSKACFLTSN
jgi:hypothetical protein